MKFSNKMRFSKGWFTGLVLGVASSAAVVYATVVTVPNTFAPNTPILAAEMNANFDAIAGCSSDMTAVGSFCIDLYEASVWNVATGGTVGVDELTGAACNPNGNDCTNIFAQSRAGVTPVGDFSWFQAQQACANAGKRLPTNAEWQMAVAGTPDPGLDGDDGSTTCNTGGASGVGTVVNAGSRSGCVSNHGAFDMVGNLWEWVADWIQADGTDTVDVMVTGNPETVTSTSTNLFDSDTAAAAFGSDMIINIGDAPSQGAGGFGFPAALLRGSDFTQNRDAGVFGMAANIAPSFADTANERFGFRCAR